MTSQISPEIAEFKLVHLDAGVGTFAVPGTGYRIALTVPEDFDAPTGRRIRGRVRGHALRIALSVDAADSSNAVGESFRRRAATNTVSNHASHA